MSAITTNTRMFIEFALRLRAALRGFLRRILPDVDVAQCGSDSDDEFNQKLDNALKEAASPNAPETAYMRAILSPCYNELCRIVKHVKEIATLTGFKEFADKYLKTTSILGILRNKDYAILEKIESIVGNESFSVQQVFVEAGAAIEGRAANSYDRLSHEEKQKAEQQANKFIATANSMIALGFQNVSNRLIEFHSDVKSGIDKMDGKLGEINDGVGAIVKKAKGRAPRFSKSQLEFSKLVWDKADGNYDLKCRSNSGRITYESVFSAKRDEFAKIGIMTAKMFESAVRAARRLMSVFIALFYTCASASAATLASMPLMASQNAQETAPDAQAMIGGGGGYCSRRTRSSALRTRPARILRLAA